MMKRPSWDEDVVATWILAMVVAVALVWCMVQLHKHNQAWDEYFKATQEEKR